MPKMVDERFVEMVFIFGILSFKSTDGKKGLSVVMFETQRTQ
jgi:hypothetical protein